MTKTIAGRLLLAGAVAAGLAMSRPALAAEDPDVQARATQAIAAAQAVRQALVEKQPALDAYERAHLDEADQALRRATRLAAQGRFGEAVRATARARRELGRVTADGHPRERAGEVR